MALLHKRKTKITTVWTDKSSFLQNRVWLPGVKAYFQSAITVQYTYWTLILQLQQLLWEGKGQTLRKDDSCAGLIYKKKHIYLWPRYSLCTSLQWFGNCCSFTVLSLHQVSIYVCTVVKQIGKLLIHRIYRFISGGKCIIILRLTCSL